MKTKYLIMGILIGGILGFFITNILKKPVPVQKEIKTELNTIADVNWEWPENLDALVAAPNNHKVVYEDDDVRILAVVLDGKESEPIHTHKWRSVMWIAKPGVPCQIKTYKKNEKGELVVSDSLVINEMPVDVGQPINPEGPTSIANLGSDNGVAYRVEFKKEFVE